MGRWIIRKIKRDAAMAKATESDGGNEKNLCVICRERNRDILLLPCKHLCCCKECFTEYCIHRFPPPQYADRTALLPQIFPSSEATQIQGQLQYLSHFLHCLNAALSVSSYMSTPSSLDNAHLRCPVCQQQVVSFMSIYN